MSLIATFHVLSSARLDDLARASARRESTERWLGLFPRTVVHDDELWPLVALHGRELGPSTLGGAAFLDLELVLEARGLAIADLGVAASPRLASEHPGVVALFDAESGERAAALLDGITGEEIERFYVDEDRPDGDGGDDAVEAVLAATSQLSRWLLALGPDALGLLAVR